MFALKDPRSFTPLVTYFTQNTEEATRRFNHNRYEWYELLFELNPQATLELLVNTLDIGDEYMTYIAYRELSARITSQTLIDACMPRLESLALRSSKSLA